MPPSKAEIAYLVVVAAVAAAVGADKVAAASAETGETVEDRPARAL